MAEKWEATGSRVICQPPVLDTDEDYVILTDDFQAFQARLEVEGFLQDTDYPGENFTSFKKGKLNYIVTDKEEFFNRFCLATKIAKKLNLLKKEDRKALFKVILYGEI